MSATELDRLRATDIYLIDQVLKGRLDHLGCVVDVGAGAGRNLPWFVGRAERVVALDPRPEAFEAMDEGLSELGFNAKARAGVERVLGRIEDAPLEPGVADLVICNAVLHFAEDAAGFEAMLRGAWALVAPGGMFFARLASSVGIEGRLVPLGGGRFLLPDESERFLVDACGLEEWPDRLGAERLEPVKTTVVSGLRAMSTWVLRAPDGMDRVTV
jgi:hypothetical protein